MRVFGNAVATKISFVFAESIEGAESLLGPDVVDSVFFDHLCDNAHHYILISGEILWV